MLLAADPVITEFVASNSGGILDGDGDSSDWIEIFNPGDTSINLQGWHLTDDRASLSKWTFPSAELGEGQFVLVFASGKNKTDGQRIPAHELRSEPVRRVPGAGSAGRRDDRAGVQSRVPRAIHGRILRPAAV